MQLIFVWMEQKTSTRPGLSNVTRLINRFGDRYKILCGVDTLAMEELLMGADGWVGGLVTAFPRETVAVYRLIKAGMIEEARAIYRWFLPLLELDIHPKLVQYIKLAEAQVGLGSEYVRAPRLTLVGEEKQFYSLHRLRSLEARAHRETSGCGASQTRQSNQADGGKLARRRR